MKKVISSVLALMLVLSLTLTAFAADKSDVKSKIDSSVKYAFDGKFAVNGYGAKDSKNLLMHRKSGADVSKFKDAYVASAKQWLDEGKGQNDIVTLSMIIDNLDAYGVDTKNFEGYNLQEMLISFDLKNYYNPFGVYYVTETAHRLGLDEFGKNLANDFVKKYYKLGEGTNFWNGFGMSADDIGAFVLGVAPYKADFKEYIDDALKLSDNFKSEGGYGVTADSPNVDSTAMILAAYSAAENKEKADEVYNILLKYYDDSFGGFTSGNNAYISTANAVLALEYYYDFLTKEENNNQGGDVVVPPATNDKEQDKNDKEEQKEDEKQENLDKSDKSPATGATTVGLAVSALAMSLGATVVLKKKDN